MPDQRNALKAGVFILVAAALVAGVLVAIKGTGILTDDTARHVAAFDLGEDVGGLKPGDDVRVGGLRLGKVNAVRLDGPTGVETAAPRVLVTFSLPERIALRDGATVTVQSTVTGQAWINVESLGDGDPVPADQPLDGRPGGLSALLATAGNLGSAGTDITTLIADARTKTFPKIEKAIDSAGGAADALRDTAQRVRDRADPLIDRYADAADQATRALADIRGAVGENRPGVRKVVASAVSIADRVEASLPDLIADARAIAADAKVGVSRAKDALGDIKAFTGDVRPAAPDAKGLLADARAATQEARSLLVSNRGRIDDIVENVQDASEQLDKASGEIRRSPWRLLYRPDKNEAGNLDLFDAARQFADGANDLSDASTALRDALADPKADQQRLQSMMTELQTTFDRFEVVQAGLFDRIRK